MFELKFDIHVMAVIQMSLLILSAFLNFKEALTTQIKKTLTTQIIHKKRILTIYVFVMFFCNCLFILKVSPALYFLGIAEFREILLSGFF